MRTLTRCQPTTDMRSLNRGMERLFDDLVGREFVRIQGDGQDRGSWKPAVNILEKSEGISITVDLPGLGAQDVEVSVDKNQLTLRGERNFDEAAEGETYHRIERFSGLFERTFRLPETVDSTKIEARFKNGEMLILLPKREETQPRVVEVAVEENS